MDEVDYAMDVGLDRLHEVIADGHEVFLYADLQDGIVVGAVGEAWKQRLYERLR